MPVSQLIFTSVISAKDDDSTLQKHSEIFFFLSDNCCWNNGNCCWKPESKSVQVESKFIKVLLIFESQSVDSRRKDIIVTNRQLSYFYDHCILCLFCGGASVLDLNQCRLCRFLILPYYKSHKKQRNLPKKVPFLLQQK